MERIISFDQLPEAISEVGHKLEELKSLILQKNNHSIQDEEQLLTVEECAAFLHVSKATIYKHISKGDIPVMKRFGQNYFLKSELIAYLKTGRKKTNAEIENEAEDRLLKSRRR
ncbi:MAG: DNA-binding protein [Marinilabiliales bacterium]|nr:MAG: DNA-binding protein [Marinilabiliales bacterium]